MTWPYSSRAMRVSSLCGMDGSGRLHDHVGGGLRRLVGGLGQDAGVGVGGGDDAGVAAPVPGIPSGVTLGICAATFATGIGCASGARIRPLRAVIIHACELTARGFNPEMEELANRNSEGISASWRCGIRRRRMRGVSRLPCSPATSSARESGQPPTPQAPSSSWPLTPRCTRWSRSPARRAPASARPSRPATPRRLPPATTSPSPGAPPSCGHPPPGPSRPPSQSVLTESDTEVAGCCVMFSKTRTVCGRLGPALTQPAAFHTHAGPVR